MKNILIGCPVLYNGETCLKAFRSVIKEADLLIIDNNSTPDVKKAISQICAESLQTEHQVCVIRNQTNEFVNKAWNTCLSFFLNNNNWDQLVIMNSDLIIAPGWSNHLEDGISCIPCDGTLKDDVEVFSGTMGVFIHLNKKMAEMIYPIPEDIKCWFGDDWGYSILRELGIKTVVKYKMVALHHHGGSQTLAILPNKSEIIEQDKIAWAEIVESLMWERIKELKKSVT